MKNKWLVTGVNVCDRNVRIPLSKMGYTYKKPKVKTKNTQTEENEFKVG